MKKIFLSILFALLTLSTAIAPSYAFSWPFPKPVIPSPKPVFIPVMILPTLNEGKHYVEVKISNYSQVDHITILITYTANGINDGATATFGFGDGTLKDSIQPVTFRAEFMTCSSGSCIVAKNVKHVKVTADTVYKSGKTSHQVFNLKP